MIRYMKVMLDSTERELLFQTCEHNELGLTVLSSHLGYHRRTLYDWRRGKYLMPLEAFQRLVNLAHLDINALNPTLIDEKEQRQRAGSIGGSAQWAKNGRIGTIEDKIKGGTTSYHKRKLAEDSMFSRKKILKPRKSSGFSEFIGISMGDGCITDYQVTISLNSVDDEAYIQYVAFLCERLFGIVPSVLRKGSSKCTNIVLSSRELVEFLVNTGLPKGDKIRNCLDIPDWIRQDKRLSAACMRGLFDTDGSVFLETHKINGTCYSYPRWAFVSASERLRKSVSEILLDHGLRPKMRMNRSVNLERFTDIDKYFKIIGSSNAKHLKRIAKFGEVG